MFFKISSSNCINGGSWNFLLLLLPSSCSLHAALRTQVIMQNTGSEKCKVIYGWDRPTLFVLLGQQYQNLDNYASWTWAVTFVLEKKFRIACVCESFFRVTCLLRLIAITSSDLILESFINALLINERINDFWSCLMLFALYWSALLRIGTYWKYHPP